MAFFIGRFCCFVSSLVSAASPSYCWLFSLCPTRYHKSTVFDKVNMPNPYYTIESLREVVRWGGDGGVVGLERKVQIALINYIFLSG